MRRSSIEKNMLKILFEDNHLIAVNKKNSDIVQGDKTGDISLDQKIKEMIRVRDNKPGNVFLGVPHRLDRPVSGVLVFAKTGKALSRMNTIFRNKEAKKIYWAIVKDLPEKTEDTIHHYLIKNPEKNKSFISSSNTPGAKLASLTYRLIGSSENFYLLEIELHTGRHHQIRAQLAAIGSPVKGDLKYGFPRSNKNAGISLHARELSFIHPVQKEEIRIVAEPPEDDLFKVFF